MLWILSFYFATTWTRDIVPWQNTHTQVGLWFVMHLSHLISFCHKSSLSSVTYPHLQRNTSHSVYTIFSHINPNVYYCLWILKWCHGVHKNDLKTRLKPAFFILLHVFFTRFTNCFLSGCMAFWLYIQPSFCSLIFMF